MARCARAGGSQPEPALSIVIPAYNAGKYLAEQLDALITQSPPFEFEIIVADNRSTDDTAAIAASYATCDRRIRLVDARSRQGTNVARNRGCRAARAKRIALADADDRACDGWIEAIHSALDDFDCVAGTLEPFGGSGSYRPTGGLRTGHGFLPAPTGASCGFRREVFEHLDGFDEAYSAGGDEVEFFWRAQLTGYSIGIAPDARMAYRLRGTKGDQWRQTLGYARARVRLFADFRQSGMPRSSVSGAVKAWLWLLVHVPRALRDTDHGERWRRVCAQRVGRIQGSIQHRVLYL